MAAADLTAARLRELLSYDPETGVFFRIGRPRYNSITGRVAGTRHSKGYISFSVDGISGLYAHRLAWLYMTGEWPKSQIDHLNGDKKDNRWVNLREVDGFSNQQNQRKAKKHNSNGLLGVYRNGKTGFMAKIKTHGISQYLGTFRTPEEAHEAYLSAKRVLHTGCTL